MNHTLAILVVALVGPFLLTAPAQDGTWRSGLAPISARALGAAATVAGKVYMVGGGNYSCGITSALQGYDPVSNVWAGNPGCGSPVKGVS